MAQYGIMYWHLLTTYSIYKSKNINMPPSVNNRHILSYTLSAGFQLLMHTLKF